MTIRTIIFSLICSLCLTASSVLFKLGLNRIGVMELTFHDWPKLLYKVLLSPWILSGLFLTMASMLFYFDLLSKYNLNYIYPILSIVYVFTAFAGIIFLGERISFMNWLGIILICLGVSLVSLQK